MNGSTVMREQNFQCAGLQHLEHANGEPVTWWGNRLPLYSLGMLSHICIHNWLLVRPNDAYLQQTQRCPVYLSFQLLQMVVSFQSKPTRMSAQAPSSTLTVLCWNCSPVSGCNVGSIEMLWHTSVSTSTVISLMRLCLRVGKPPVGQLKACSMGIFHSVMQTDSIFESSLVQCEPMFW